jgi:hypothetical protein
VTVAAPNRRFTLAHLIAASTPQPTRHVQSATDQHGASTPYIQYRAPAHPIQSRKSKSARKIARTHLREEIKPSQALHDVFHAPCFRLAEEPPDVSRVGVDVAADVDDGDGFEVEQLLEEGLVASFSGRLGCISTSTNTKASARPERPLALSSISWRHCSH